MFFYEEVIFKKQEEDDYLCYQALQKEKKVAH